MHNSMPKVLSLIATQLVLASLPAPAPARAQGAHPAGSAMPRVDARPQVLAPGDMVRLTVWKQANFSGDFAVSAEGALKHPIFQDIRIVGVPLDTVRERIAAVLSKYEENPQFTVEPLYRVAISGAVQQPNLYSLPRETTLAQAVALAGGPSERGRADRVKLIRDGHVYRIDLTRFDQGLSATTVRTGDQLVVPRQRKLFTDYILPTIGLSGAVAALITVLKHSS
jgi:protein involved in polysaccharide export with SLBB domain